jgi:hypothetical protein
MASGSVVDPAVCAPSAPLVSRTIPNLPPPRAAHGAFVLLTVSTLVGRYQIGRQTARLLISAGYELGLHRTPPPLQTNSGAVLGIEQGTGLPERPERIHENEEQH